MNDKVIKDQKNIANAQKNFYQNLNSEKFNSNDISYKDSLDTFINKQNPMKRLSDEEHMLCDRPISESEILLCLKYLNNEKETGTDGLPADFYKFFWFDIKGFIMDSLLHAIKTGELSIEQKQDVITLLPKKNKDRLFLKHWRPISLLNTDYKILVKLLANRMKEVLPSIISEDQSGYLKGRYIGQNIRLLQDISFFIELKQLPCTLLAIDFEKDFDSLNWKILLKTLKHLNFGPNFISYVKFMYNNIESAILNNGSTGNYFKLERGVRQGCPLSVYLFILAIEVLANKIRNDPDIKGIKIDNKELKIRLLADDITLILKDLLSLEYSIKPLNSFNIVLALN